MIPYRDENETQRPAIITAAIIVVNFLVWILVQGAGSTLALTKSVCELGLIPGELTLSLPVGTAFSMGDNLACLTDSGRQVSHVFTSMFLHGSWMHIIGNMWFLWIFGNNIEDSMGRLRFIVFYLVCGLAAAMGQVLAGPASATPMVGASGAISGVMGAYLILFPKVRVYTLVPLIIIFTSIAMPAWVMLGYWFAVQIISGLVSTGEGGVAVWAHVGGFIAGIVLIKFFTRDDYLQAHRTHNWRPRQLMLD